MLIAWIQLTGMSVRLVLCTTKYKKECNQGFLTKIQEILIVIEK